MPYNLSIPGWMPEAELQIIERVAATIPRDGVMVEVGPFLGRSSWCWAKSVDPSVKVYCLDIWDIAVHPYSPPSLIGGTQGGGDYGVAARIEDTYGTLENFKRCTSDCPNIEPIQGASPRSFLNWQRSLDLVFLDGVHHNPPFWDDLNFWFWKIKPGGILCGDDCARSHPDVLWGIHDFAKNHNLTFMVQGRLWFIPRVPRQNFFRALFPELDLAT
jgi:hypothetical protein